MDALELRPWSDDDLPLLRRANTAEMTAHINGPETDEQVTQRHERYLRLNAAGEAHMFVILDGGHPVGSIGYWNLD